MKNVCEFLLFSQLYDGEALERACVQFIFENLSLAFENGYGV